MASRPGDVARIVNDDKAVLSADGRAIQQSGAEDRRVHESKIVIQEAVQVTLQVEKRQGLAPLESSIPSRALNRRHRTSEQEQIAQVLSSDRRLQ
jgi:hypothetical protein